MYITNQNPKLQQTPKDQKINDVTNGKFSDEATRVVSWQMTGRDGVVHLFSNIY